MEKGKLIRFSTSIDNKPMIQLAKKFEFNIVDIEYDNYGHEENIVFQKIA